MAESYDIVVQSSAMNKMSSDTSNKILEDYHRDFLMLLKVHPAR